MTKKHQRKNFLRKYYSQLVVLSVMLLVGSSLLITTPSSAFSLSTNEDNLDSPLKQDSVLQENKLDYEYSPEDDDDDLSALNEENDVDENDLPDLNEENDVDEDDSPDLNEERGNDEGDLPHLSEENDDEENKPITIIGFNEKAKLEKVPHKAGSFSELQSIVNTAEKGVNNVIDITASFDFDSELTITDDRHITIQSYQMGSEYILKQSGNNRHFIIDNNSSLTLETGIVLDGGKSMTTGGGVTVANGGHIIMEGGEIRNCFRQDSGGSVDVSNGMITMKDGDIYNSRTLGLGGTVFIQDGTFIMEGGSIHKSSAMMGGAVFIQDGTFIMEGGSIHKSSAMMGGAVSIQGGKFIIKDGVIHNNEADMSGGAVFMPVGEFIMEGGEIHHNTAKISGGGITVQLNASFTMKGGHIHHNRSLQNHGGGIEAQAPARVTLESGKISQNTAHASGGGVYSNGPIIMKGDVKIYENEAVRGGGIYSAVDFDMTGGEVYSNKATTNSPASSDISSGGGIWINGAFTLRGGLIRDNEADFFGGGVYVHQSGTFTATEGSTIGGNKANHGGGIFSSGGSLNLSGTKIEYNNARNGGGIYSENGQIYMQGGIIRNNKATIPLDTDNDQHPSSNGGGIWSSGEFLMHGGAIDNNTAARGGGIFIHEDGSVTIQGAAMIQNNNAIAYTNCTGRDCATGLGGGALVEGTFIMMGGEISHNTATNLGGGLWARGESEIHDGVIDNNTAALGGGIFINIEGSVSVKDGKITNNHAIGNYSGLGAGGGALVRGKFHMDGGEISGNTAIGNGGGVLSTGDSKISGGKISNNSASNGAGIYQYIGSLKIELGNISNNTATDNGGGVYSEEGEFKMSGGEISHNTATHGGGIFSSGGDLELDTMVIEYNNAWNGGGIYTENTEIHMIGGKISDNNATGNGGGIYSKSGVLGMNGGEISGNDASVDGGGIFSDGVSSMNLFGTNIKGNSARNGGGVYSKEGTITLTGSIIEGNKAVPPGNVDGQQPSYNKDSYHGGGLWTSGEFLMEGGAIDNNTAAGGGGIFIHEDGSVTIQGAAMINNNSAIAYTDCTGGYCATGLGGGALVEGTFTMTNGIIFDNTATNLGGGLWASGDSEMHGGVITSNKAALGGGIFINVEGSVRVKNGSIIHNEAIGNSSGLGAGGGALVRGKFEMSGGEISSNTASGNGGGVLSTGESEMNGGKISDNRALNGAGIYQYTGSLTMKLGNISGNTATNHGGGVYSEEGTFVMEGGNISHNKATNGGGIYQYGGTLSMQLGNISSNTATNHGGGIFSSSGFLNLYGMFIEYNYARNGGGIYCENGQVYMTGGQIRYNKATTQIADNIANTFGVPLDTNDDGKPSSNGGGLWISGNFNMLGGDIKENEAEFSGGGVFVNTQGRFHIMNIGVDIHDNKAIDGAGVMVQGEFIMKDGKIYDNTASGDGGGVMVIGDFIMSKGEIRNNTADRNGGGIYAPSINLTNIILYETVELEKNSAAHSYPPPLGVEDKLTNIKTRSNSITGYNHPLNNYDIGYSKIDPPVHTLSIESNPIFGGDVVDSDEINLNHLTFMDEGIQVDLQAQPMPGYRFVRWKSSAGGSFTNQTEVNTTFTTPNNDTVITAIFDRMTLDPLNPSEQVNPESPITLPEADGFINIDFVSSFDFGKNKISFTNKPYYANPQRLLGLLDENGQELQNEVRPNYIQITDNRAVNNGWTLSVTQLDQFKEYGEDEGHVLEGASLTLQHAELVSATDPDLTPPSRVEEDVTLTPGKNQPLIVAQPDEGKAVWIYRFGNEDNFREGVKLEVPAIANPRATSYQTTLHWELSWGPDNLIEE